MTKITIAVYIGLGVIAGVLAYAGTSLNPDGRANERTSLEMQVYDLEQRVYRLEQIIGK